MVSAEGSTAAGQPFQPAVAAEEALRKFAQACAPSTRPQPRSVASTPASLLRAAAEAAAKRRTRLPRALVAAAAVSSARPADAPAVSAARKPIHVEVLPTPAPAAEAAVAGVRAAPAPYGSGDIGYTAGGGGSSWVVVWAAGPLTFNTGVQSGDGKIIVTSTK